MLQKYILNRWITAAYVLRKDIGFNATHIRAQAHTTFETRIHVIQSV